MNEMYKVQIQEILTLTVEIEAKSPQQALATVSEQHLNGKYEGKMIDDVQFHLLGNEESEGATERTTEDPASISFPLSGGTRIVAQLCGDAECPGMEAGWSSIDIVAEYPNGGCENLCCVDVSLPYIITHGAESTGYNRLRVMAFLPGEEDPAVTLEPLSHRSIWPSFADGTYTINVRDEDRNVVVPIEESNFQTLEQVSRKIQEIFNESPHIVWTKLALAEASGKEPPQ